MTGRLFGRLVGPVLALAALGAANAPSLLPPIRGPLAVTSSFGEFRPGHYHGGIDLSTGGREGVPVQAPEDGWVFRLRASGIGYGRAVYFRLEDGRTVLFGHLSRFAPRIAARVEAVQDREGRYEVDFRPEPGEVSFRRGEILGYSGQSGAGPPHLHAEMRVGEDAAVAVNPLGQGWSVPDTVAPRITRLRVEPASAGDRVNGGVMPAVLPAKNAAVRVSGGFRLWVECSDYTQAGAYRLAPYAVRATLDGALEAAVRLDRFNWNWAREVEWTFDNARARIAGERWICLEAPPGSRQGIAEETPRWTRALSPGTHRIEVEAEDGNGNRTAAVLTCRVEPEAGTPLTGPSIPRTDVESRGAFLQARVAGAGMRVVARSASGDTAAMTAIPAPGGSVAQLQTPPAAGPWSVVSAADTDSVLAWALYIPGAGTDAGASAAGPETLAREGVRLVAGRDASYGPLWITLEPGDVGAGAAVPSELAPVGNMVRLGPWAWPLRDRIRITLDVPPGVSRRGLAVMSRAAHGWSFEGADTTAEGVTAELPDLEDLALFRDRTPPAVHIDSYAAGARTLTARITETGVGLTWRDIAMTLNGRPVVAEWDPEAKRLTGHLRTPPAPGTYTLVVTAADRVGNRAQKRLVFTVAQ